MSCHSGKDYIRRPYSLQASEKYIKTYIMSWAIKEKVKQALAAEEGAIVKDFGGKRPIVVVFPNRYHVGMSNLGIHSIYRIINSSNEFLCERAFLPEKAEIREIERTNAEILTIENQKPLTDFEIIAFSIPFENDFDNIEKILKLSKIPVKRNDRLNKKYPKLICGGATVKLVPSAFEEIFDEVITEDADEYFGRLTGSMPGKETPARSVIWTDNTEFGSMHLVEIQRGCPHRCKFCAAPSIYFPFKQYSKEEIIKAIDFGLPYRKKVGLIGGDVLAHPDFVEIAEYIHSKDASFSPASVRADRITPKIAELLKLSGHKTVTLAPEAGSEILRKKIGKNISDNKFFQAAEILSIHGIRQIKLYFMIGLPDETDFDLKSIHQFTVEMKKFGISKLSLAINPFIPKIKTQFSEEKIATPEEIKKKELFLKKLFKGNSWALLKFESPIAAIKEYEFQR